MFKKVLSLFDYIKMLQSKYNELQQQLGNVYRIVKITKNKKGDHVLHIQIINKSTIFTCKASEIVSNDHLLECFSKKDIRIITYMATQEVHQPKRKIISFQLNNGLKKILFKLSNRNCAQIEEYTGNEISHNKKILNDLNQEDAHKIGYLTAFEEINSEKEMIQNLKKKN